MNAIAMEKCFYSAYWQSVSISISKYKQVKISYANDKNFEINDAENAKLKKEVF
jgi:helix-turn-helix protein